jgi:SAM-dependent methyltransferase
MSIAMRRTAGAAASAGGARAARSLAQRLAAAVAGTLLPAGLLTAGLPAAAHGQQPAATRDSAAPQPKRTPDVIYVPTPPEVVRQMLDVARVNKNDVLYDLGSGDGRIVVEAARRYGARGIGIDINPERIREANANAKKAGVTGRVQFLEQDLFETDISKASVVTLYLLPSLNVKLRPTLFKLRPGTRIVSHDFDMGDWQADSTMRVNSETRGTSTVYYWLIPADVGGSWSLETQGAGENGGAQRYALRLEQQYQRVTGSAESGGRTLSVTDGRLAGDRFAFSVADTVDGRRVTMRFSGRVTGNTMSGTVSGAGGAERQWRATRGQGGGATGARPAASPDVARDR